MDEVLRKLGFEPGHIVECIVITVDGRLRPNAAPIGIFRAPSGRLAAEIFKDTTTYSNLLEIGEATINVTTDVGLFYRALFDKLDESSMSSSETVKPPRLKDADAVIETEVDDVTDRGDRAAFEMIPTRVAVVSPFPKGFRRCDFSVIESLIHLTRVRAFARTDKRRARELADLIMHYYSYVIKRCPESHVEIMRDLLMRVRKYVGNAGRDEPEG